MRLTEHLLRSALILATGWAVTSALPAQATTIPGERPVYSGAGTGAHFWIDGSSGNDTFPGTEAQPWRTIDRIEVANLAPGDVVHVRAGNYTPINNLRLQSIHGTAAAWIGIEAEGAVRLRNTAYYNVVEISDCRYLYLRGFEITHDNGSVPMGSWSPIDAIKFQSQNSNDISIDSCQIHDVGGTGVASQAPEVRNLIVYNCEIWNCQNGIYWGYYEHLQKRYAHFGRIAANYIRDCPPLASETTGYGIQIKGGSHGNIIEDNVLVRCGGTLRAAIALYHSATQFGPAASRNVISGNLVRGARNEGIYAAEGAIIENNVVVGSARIGIALAARNTGSWGVFWGNLSVRNNTVFDVANATGIGLSIQHSNAFTSPFIVANNVCAVTGASSKRALSGPFGFAGAASHNHCYGATYGTNLGALPLPGLSAFASTSFGHGRFLFPAAAGALAGGAHPAHASDADFDGRTRSALIDAGAYQSIGSSTPAWTLSESFKRALPLEGTPSVNQATFATNQTTRVDVALVNPGSSCIADIYFGILMPNGQRYLWLDSPGLVSGALRPSAHPETWIPAFTEIDLSRPFTVNLPDIYRHTWIGIEPHGNYRIEVLAVSPGSLADGTIDPGDILSAQSVILTFNG